MPLTFADVVREGYGFGSILRAIERLILMRSPVLPNTYEANFEGITRALWDLGTVLSGDIPPSGEITSGLYPPNWSTVTNDYVTGGEPRDGWLWFDRRQGRLFVADGGEWFQANGAESLLHIGPDEPARRLPGTSWFDTRQGVTLAWIDAVTANGEEGWYQTNGGSEAGGGSAPFEIALPAGVETQVAQVNGDQAILLFKTRSAASQSVWTAGQLNLAATSVLNQTAFVTSGDLSGPGGRFDVTWRLERLASDPELINVYATSTASGWASGRVVSSV